MPASKRPTKRNRRSVLIAGAVLIPLALLVLVVGAFGFAATQEKRDAFCASCHTQPESTYYSREQASAPTDLASFHTTKETRCIDCHSGPGVTGRVSAELLGARNALAFFTHTAKQPAPLTFPIADANCVKCHAQVTQGQATRNNHFHIFLARWQAADPKGAATCAECHNGHITGSQAQSGFMDRATVTAVCERCHATFGEGD